MCGVAGIVALRPDGRPPELAALHAMAHALAHRGPDEFGYYRDARAGLAHARLSIIDLAAGQQPLCNEDGSLWVVFNGEIFNYVELRGALIGLGHRFRTRSDTEVIVHAYEQWGAGAFTRFNGQWAIALWDAARAELVLARDPYGVRPLYLAEADGRLIFASEVKAMFAGCPQLPRALDPIGLDQVFTFWAPLAPQTVFTGVTELPPGHLRIYRDGTWREQAYWAPRYPTGENGGFRGSLAEAAAALREALENAVRLRVLRSDVTVGGYLSGGIDSSVTAALGSRYNGGAFRTFSIRFDKQEYDETGYQRLMVERLGSEHAEIRVSGSDIAAAFPGVIYHGERPVLRTAAVPLYLLSRLVRDSGIKVVLTGEGADEMLAGYDIFREAKVRRFWARRPESQLRPLLLDRLYPYLARSPVSARAMARKFFGRNLAQWRQPGFSHELRWHTTSSVKRHFSAELRARIGDNDAVGALRDSLPPAFRDWPVLAQDQYIEIRTLLSSYLLSSQGDRMLMAHSVEGRFPFLDAELTALADSLPPSYKLRVLDEKHVLKAACGDLLPEAILTRKKQPYRAPDALSFVDRQAPDWVADALAPDAVAQARLFNPRAVQQLWKRCLQNRDGQLSNADNMALVGVLSTQLLHEHFIAQAPEVSGRVAFTTAVDRLARPP